MLPQEISLGAASADFLEVAAAPWCCSANPLTRTNGWTVAKPGNVQNSSPRLLTVTQVFSDQASHIFQDPRAITQVSMVQARLLPKDLRTIPEVHLTIIQGSSTMTYLNKMDN